MDEQDRRTIFRFFTEIGIINQLSRAMIEARLPPDLTATHFGLIGHLMRRPDGETPLQLATAFQLPKTTMTHMIKVLQRHGLVQVVPNAADGRSKLVVLTPAAGGFMQQKMQAMAPAMDQVLAQLPKGALENVLPGLEEIRAVLDRQRD